MPARIGLVAVVLTCLAACAGSASAGIGDAQAVPRAPYAPTVRYLPAPGDVPNPERGFFRQFTPFRLGTEEQPFDDRTLAAVRAEGLSMIRAYFVIDEFRTAPIATAALDHINTDFAAVRRAGLKIVPRFTYNFPGIGRAADALDAPLDRVLEHLDQLAPVLVANADVIAFMETGFVGAWGEWHSSSSGLLEPDHSLNTRSAAILARLLSVLPATRMTALRYAFHKQQLYGPLPLTPSNVYRGSPQARVGAHNDCLASGPTDTGTYSPPSRFAQSIDALKTYLGLDNRFVPQGGETCGADGDPVILAPEAHCASALVDLARMRWSTLHLGYHPAIIALWQQEGCVDEIRSRLGYRFRLLDAHVTAQAQAGRRWGMALRLVNDGWAAPYNPRLVELVLRHEGSGRLIRFPLTEDPRFWGAGETRLLSFSTVLPPDLEDGDYDVLLDLPDPERGLYGVPAYSIRLANDGVWEPDTGFNDLHARVHVRLLEDTRPNQCAGDDRRDPVRRCP
ncbi:MAG: DUF4832 domain-containing protein [Vicinamibacterales bacterium]